MSAFQIATSNHPDAPAFPRFPSEDEGKFLGHADRGHLHYDVWLLSSEQGPGLALIEGPEKSHLYFPQEVAEATALQFADSVWKAAIDLRDLYEEYEDISQTEPKADSIDSAPDDKLVDEVSDQLVTGAAQDVRRLLDSSSLTRSQKIRSLARCLEMLVRPT